MTTEEVEERLQRALEKVREEDLDLLRFDVSERCIATRLAMYLREYFVDYDVDVEYNRHGTQVKRLYRLGRLVENHPRDRDETQPQSVLPDVIVHKRGVNDSNLLVIEMNKSSNRQGMNGDKQRIKAFREQLGSRSVPS